MYFWQYITLLLFNIAALNNHIFLYKREVALLKYGNHIDIDICCFIGVYSPIASVDVHNINTSIQTFSSLVVIKLMILRLKSLKLRILSRHTLQKAWAIAQCKQTALTRSNFNFKMPTHM